ncbi:MAG: tetratricopeptide repeat protein [Elainellaceae cyanobacterium]
MQCSVRKASAASAIRRAIGLRLVLAVGLSSGLVLLPQIDPRQDSVAFAQALPSGVSQAYTLLDQGRVDEAIAQFQRAVQAYPQSVQAQLGLAIAYRRAGEDANALNAYERVLAIDPSNQLALNSIGLLGEFRPEWQQRGIEALTTLLSINPSDDDARAQRGLLYLFQGRLEESVADYAQVLQRSPSQSALIGAAQAFTYSGNYSQGAQLFERYQLGGGQLNADQAIAYALALQETNRVAQAVQVLANQLYGQTPFNSNSIKLRGALAQTYAEAQQYDQALQVLAPLQGRPDSRLVLARGYDTIGRLSNTAAYRQAAAAIYRQILEQTPQITAGQAREMADALSDIDGEEAYALEVYRQLRQQYPGDRSLTVQQTLLEYRLNRLSAEALATTLQQLLQPLPTAPLQRRISAQALIQLDPPVAELLPIYQDLARNSSEAFLYFRIAQIFLQQNRLDAAQDALMVYRSTPAGAADTFSTTLLLADIERQSGDLEASAGYYQSILSSRPNDRDLTIGALSGLASIRQQQGRLDEAIALYDQIIAIAPDNSAYQLGRTSLLYGGDRISEAEAEAVLTRWLATEGASTSRYPAEVYALAGVLPPDPNRSALYRQLLEADPDNIAVRLRSIQVLAQRNPTLARAQVNQLVAQDPDNLDLYLIQGQIAQDTGNFGTAARVYEYVLSQDPNNIGALLSLGGGRFNQRQYERATEAYAQALAIDDTNAIAREALTDLSVVDGQRMEALAQLEQWQLEQVVEGSVDPALMQEMQEIREGYLQQRGLQPAWERF